VCGLMLDNCGPQSTCGARLTATVSSLGSNSGLLSYRGHLNWLTCLEEMQLKYSIVFQNCIGETRTL